MRYNDAEKLMTGKRGPLDEKSLGKGKSLIRCPNGCVLMLGAEPIIEFNKNGLNYIHVVAGRYEKPRTVVGMLNKYADSQYGFYSYRGYVYMRGYGCITNNLVILPDGRVAQRDDPEAMAYLDPFCRRVSW